MSRWLTLVIMLLVVGAIGVAAWRYRAGRDISPENQAAREAAVQGMPTKRDSIAALGRLVPKGGVIDVGALAGSRVGQILVAEGQTVASGDPLAHMQEHALRETELAFARTQLAEAEEKLKAELAYAESVVRESQIGLEQAKLQANQVAIQEKKAQLLAASAELANKNLARLTGLSERVVSAQQHEEAELQAQQARTELAAAKEQLEQSQKSQQLAVVGAEARLAAAQVKLDRTPAAAPLESLRQGVKLAELKLEQSIVRAPIDGRVLRILLQPGEVVGQQPIMQLGAVQQMEVVAEVYETDIGLIRSGQRALITSPALPEKLDGTVERISTMVAQNEVMSLDPAARADVRVVPVHIRLENSEAAARLVNLQVDVLIQVDAAPANGNVRVGSARRTPSSELQYARAPVE